MGWIVDVSHAFRATHSLQNLFTHGIHAHVYVYICVRERECMCTYVCVCMCIYIHNCMYVYVYVHVLHIYVCNQLRSILESRSCGPSYSVTAAFADFASPILSEFGVLGYCFNREGPCRNT